MTKVCVISTSTVFEPRTTVSATTSFARFLDDTAFGAYGTVGRRSDGWWLHVDIGQYNKEKNAIIVKSHCLVCVSLYLHVISLELTFASLGALKPPVINVPVANTPAILKPSTARSATTGFAGFLERVASWARHRTSDRGGDDTD